MAFLKFVRLTMLCLDLIICLNLQVFHLYIIVSDFVFIDFLSVFLYDCCAFGGRGYFCLFVCPILISFYCILFYFLEAYLYYNKIEKEKVWI